LGEAIPELEFSSEGRGLIFDLCPLPSGPSLADLLSQRTVDPLEFLKTQLPHLLKVLSDLHEQGLSLSALDPNEIFLNEERCLLFPFSLAPPSGLRWVLPGYSAPEFFGRCREGRLDPSTDLFFVGVFLYYLFTGISPLVEAGESEERLPLPLVYASIPPDLVAIIRRAVSPIPERRYQDAQELLFDLRSALQSLRARRRARIQAPKLDIGHEIHIGVLKGQYSPQNQDDLFLAWHGATGVGLFVISDGVSISQYGSGNLASDCVREASASLWRRIIEGQIHADSETGLKPLLPEEESERLGLLRAVLEEANVAIAELIHDEMPQFPGPPEGIMAATAVMALVDGEQISLASIGDSRIYLLRDGRMVSLMVDHNLTTQLICLGRSPKSARAVPNSHALVRCVGEFDKEGDQLIPVPLEPELKSVRILPGDTLILCSDGIPDYAGWDEEDAEHCMAQAVTQAPDATTAAFELMVLANRGGGGDNISCIVLRFLEEEVLL